MKIRDYTFFEDHNILLPTDLTRGVNSEFAKNFKKKYLEEKKFFSPKDVFTSIEDIKQKISNVSFLILELTEDCNLRCKYCVFSGSYKHLKKRTQKKMRF